MQYELVQDALTGLFNSVAITGTSMIILASISTSLTRPPQQQLPNHVPHTEEPSPSVKQYLQELQQKLEQAHQEKAKFQTDLDAVKLEFEQTQQNLQQIQQELEQVQQDKSQLQSCLAVVQLESLCINKKDADLTCLRVSCVGT